MKYFIADERIPKKALSALIGRGFSPVLLPPSSSLAAPVASHPDMLLFFGDKIYVSEEYYSEAKKELDLISRLSGLSLALSDVKAKPVYPHDVAFNALPLGNMIFCKRQSLAPSIADYASRRGIAIVDVRQGYAKCSACKVSEHAIITSDESMKRAALERGIDTLIIRPGHVLLPGYDTGFIGGASGEDADCVYFCGSLDSHPDGERIRDFCKKHEKEAVSLSDEPLYDIGTLFFLHSK